MDAVPCLGQRLLVVIVRRERGTRTDDVHPSCTGVERRTLIGRTVSHIPAPRQPVSVERQAPVPRPPADRLSILALVSIYCQSLDGNSFST